ncbi:hypothetical protein COS93_02005 [bacterium (Candidatus Gribaldobacteria) CG07_land_8_20_14_0_80_33_18]|uniref:Uncharacterized protein n=1 Tax=bacterium (Candidatus Gribaldobacteria) CG07_land_8_20_14_0_80_33_18 TaxID=2014272 RepID=A0A2M6Z2X9_9BACT|nr:MAG: hypothetical protein COS93_02005 [bacterium (Candidatus Gribaldobacteria) CG07_land_8_20_14_0_80_33_18]
MKKIISGFLIFSFLTSIPLPVMAKELEVELELRKEEAPQKTEKKKKPVVTSAAPVIMEKETKPLSIMVEKVVKEVIKDESKPVELIFPVVKKKKDNDWIAWILMAGGIILAVTLQPPEKCGDSPGPGADPN